MQDAGENLEAIDNPRPRAREVRARIPPATELSVATLGRRLVIISKFLS